MLERLATLGQLVRRDAILERTCASGGRARRPGAQIRFARRGRRGSRRRRAAGARARPARARDRLALSPRRPPRGGAVSVSVPGPARTAGTPLGGREGAGRRRRHPLRVLSLVAFRGRGVCNGVPDRQTPDMSAALARRLLRLAGVDSSRATSCSSSSSSSGSPSATGRTRTRAAASRIRGWWRWRRCSA